MLSSTKNWMAVLRLVMGYIWFQAGWEKLHDPGFVSNLPKTLGFFASKNPYPWFHDLILLQFIPHAGLYANLAMYGEVLTGISLFLGLFTPIGALVSLFLNIVFFFTSGWTSPSTEGMNVIMAVLSAALLFTKAGSWWGIDSFLGRNVSSLRWLRGKYA